MLHILPDTVVGDSTFAAEFAARGGVIRISEYPYSSCRLLDENTAAVIAVIGLGSSAEKALEQSIDDLGGRTLYVSPGQNRRGAVTKGTVPLDIKDAEALAK